MADKKIVENFLREFKVKMGIFSVLFLNDRLKNIQALSELEITPKYREEILEKLQVQDYSQGPLNETQYGGTLMWVFGKQIKNHEVYIKITLGMENTSVLCISFHIAEHTMNYPFKN